MAILVFIVLQCKRVRGGLYLWNEGKGEGKGRGGGGREGERDVRQSLY